MSKKLLKLRKQLVEKYRDCYVVISYTVSRHGCSGNSYEYYELYVCGVTNGTEEIKSLDSLEARVKELLLA